ncbi:hypothetical protein GOV06_04390 [Candidatus Woesearchaeota archaeon]|nr:hypothetical protein [Candidatus Woesearchaeota archaeon]
MTKSDIIIGFERKPENLEGFLEKQEYVAVPNKEKDDATQTYEHEERGWPEVFYDSQIPEESECPDWRKSRYNIVFKLEITYPVDDFDAVDEAERLSEAIVNEFDGILYDIHSDDFFRKKDLMK